MRPSLKSPLVARVTTVVLCVFFMLVSTVQAQVGVDDPPAVAPWLPTGLGEPVAEVIAPQSGAFFARTATSLQRSDDAGATWHPISLPGASEAVGQIAIDASNHAHVLVESAGELFRTVDDARTWTLVSTFGTRRVLRMAISPADSQWVYLGLSGGTPPAAGMGDLWFMRSTDGGLTFSELEKGSGTTCAMSMPILEPHRLDPRAVFRSVACLAGRTFNAPLSLSVDGGQTFSNLLSGFGYPRQLVGGRGSAPQRWYVQLVGDARLGGASLFRSDDDGQTWQLLLAYHTDRDALGRATSADISITSVTYDPGQPDHLWVALGSDGDGVLFSPDGGETWQDDGAHDLGRISSLVLGVDGRNLYLASPQGVWRQPQDVD